MWFLAVCQDKVATGRGYYGKVVPIGGGGFGDPPWKHIDI